MVDTSESQRSRLWQAVGSFSLYSDEIRALLSDSTLEIDGGGSHAELPEILSGRTTLALQRLVPADVRRQGGMFFTGADLADRVAGRLAPMLREGISILDPACGAGNLLVACAKYLPIEETLPQTLARWSDVVSGYDLHREFVRAAQLGLVLLAASRHHEFGRLPSDLDPAETFRGIKVGDVFACERPTARAKCIIANPPFGYVAAPEDCEWARGRVQNAGVFFERLLRWAPEGQHLVAVLPDVLRSGTRYSKWREMVSRFCNSLEIELAGRFDRETDVDVFVLHVVAAGALGDATSWRWHTPRTPRTLNKVSDLFDIHVGPVVPHRNPEQGPVYPYVHARNTLAGGVLVHVEEERRYNGRVFSPPFVVVHRTSSPSDRQRCVAAVVNEQRDLAVDNHLLVLLPRDKALSSCQELVDVLMSAETTEWMNQRIRCRHITVAALAEVPWYLGHSL